MRNPAAKPKKPTYFEQVPLKVAKKVAQEESSKGVLTPSGPNRSKPRAEHIKLNG